MVCTSYEYSSLDSCQTTSIQDLVNINTIWNYRITKTTNFISFKCWRLWVLKTGIEYKTIFDLWNIIISFEHVSVVYSNSLLFLLYYKDDDGRKLTWWTIERYKFKIKFLQLNLYLIKLYVFLMWLNSMN